MVGFYLIVIGIRALINQSRVKKTRRKVLKREKSTKWNKYNGAVRKLSLNVMNTESNEYIFSPSSSTTSDEEDVEVPLTLSTD